MVSTAAGERLGPIELVPGVTRLNAITKLFASFVAIASLTGMSLLQGYILTEHLGLPRRIQGTVSGDLSFWTEIVMLVGFVPFGILADRIGRRPVFITGISLIGLGWGLYPFATSVGELLAFRLIYAVGVAGTAGTLATLVNDYPAESSRGKFIGFTAMLNVLGVVFVARVIGGIPAFMGERGYDPVTAGKTMFLSMAALCAVTAVIARFGLKAGTPAGRHERPSKKQLYTSGVSAMQNPRIALAYAAAMAARSDVVIKGLFLALWAIQAGHELGLNPGRAMARFGTMIAIMYVVSFVSAPLFGWFIDKVNRMTAMMVALSTASAGYLAMIFLSSPLEFDMLPLLILLTLGTGFMTKAQAALIGQEAPVRERGSIIATAQMFGALGVLIFTAIGGRLFDALGPWAPFVLVGSYQSLLLVAAIVIRMVAPGAIPIAARPARSQTSA
jgi:MFS family permease